MRVIVDVVGIAAAKKDKKLISEKIELLQENLV